MTVEKRLDELEKGNRRLPTALYRYLTVIFFMSGIIGTSPTSAGEEYIVDGCVDFGFLSPHGYGKNASIALDIDVLSSFKPYAGAGINVLSGLTYPGGVEYRVQIEMENAPGLTISSLLSSGGHHGTSKRHKWAFVSGVWVDFFVRSDNYAVMLGAAVGIGNINTPEEASKSEVRSFIHPAFFLGLRVP